jgi:hypothetical protein
MKIIKSVLQIIGYSMIWAIPVTMFTTVMFGLFIPILITDGEWIRMVVWVSLFQGIITKLGGGFHKLFPELNS